MTLLFSVREVLRRGKYHNYRTRTSDEASGYVGFRVVLIPGVIGTHLAVICKVKVR